MGCTNRREPARIALKSGSVDVVFLDRDAYSAFHRPLWQPPTLADGYTRCDYENEKRETESLIRTLLAACWHDGEDFEVGRDENYAFTLCGGVYAPQVLCARYLEALHGALRSTRRPLDWSYDTSVELERPVDGMDFCSFVLRGSVVTVSADDLGEFDIIARFSGRRS